MDLSFPLCVFSLLLLGYSYAQDIVISPETDKLSKKINDDGFTLTCKVVGPEPAEDPNLKWLDPKDEVIGEYSSDKNSTRNRIYLFRLGSQTRLQFESLKSDKDAGVYTCQGTINGKLVSKDITIELSKSIEVHSPAEQSPIIYTTATIECVTSFSKVPEIVWLFGSNRQPIKGDRYKQTAKGLVVDNITLADNGVYVCVITSSDGPETKFFEITVTVTVPPTMKAPAEITDPIVGRPFTMSCTAEGTPRPNFKFFKDNKELQGGRYEISVDNNPQNPASRGTLKMEELVDSDEGDYSCRAINDGGNATDTVFVDTIVPPSISEIVNQTAAEGSSVELACEARSDPAADIQWQITGTDISITNDPELGITVEESTREEPQIHIVTKLLKFSSLKPSNTNNYTCTASNSAGSDQKNGRVIVEFKPNFDNTPYAATYGWVNHNTEIKCVVDAVPYPAITWKKGDEKIENGGGFQISQEKGIRQLIGTLTVIVNIENENTIFGMYTCEAQNMHGTAQYDIALKKASVPHMPSVSIGDVSPTTIDLLISPPLNNGGQPVIDYKIVYYKEGQPDQSTTRKADVSQDPGESRSRFQIDELEAKTSYRITVEARNNVGYGAKFSVSEVTDAVSVPGTPDITSNKDADSANTYTLTWVKPQTGGSELTGYNVKYTQVEVGEGNQIKRVIGETETIKLSDGSLTSTTLSGLNPNAHYELQLTAINSIGESMAQSHIFKTPKGGMPVTGGAVSLHVSQLASLLLLLLPTALMVWVW